MSFKRDKTLSALAGALTLLTLIVEIVRAMSSIGFKNKNVFILKNQLKGLQRKIKNQGSHVISCDTCSSLISTISESRVWLVSSAPGLTERCSCGAFGVDAVS